MRFLSFLLATLIVNALTLPSAAFAQTAPPQAPPAAAPTQGCGGESGNNPMRGIQLTPAQHQQLKQIREQFRAQYPCGTKAPPQAREELRSQIMGVLTPAQQAQYQANLAAMHPPAPTSAPNA